MALHPSSLTTAITAAVLAGAGASACHEAPLATGSACELLPGDLVVSEIMVHPLADGAAVLASGGAGEWIEIYNASSRPQVLDRVVVTVSGGGRRPQVHELRGAGSLAPQGYFVLGDGGASGHLDYAYGRALELTNTGAVLALSCRGRIVDTIAYGTAGGPAALDRGRSLALDGALPPDALHNDGATAWCLGAETYDGSERGGPASPGHGDPGGSAGPGGRGSPGAANPPCGNCEAGPGDLVITELMIDPATDESSGEWIEIYNPTGTPAPLNQLSIAVATSARTRTYELGERVFVAPHAYYVLGNGPADGQPVQLSYGTALDLGNTGALVTVACAGRIVDAVAYGTMGAAVPPPGASLSLDGAQTPSALANDSSESWCPGAGAAGKYDGTNAGSPGSANETCGVFACREGGALRPVSSPAAGDLVVSEVFADPTGTDDSKEWLELYVAASTSVDLNALALEVATVSAPDEVEIYRLAAIDCRRVEPGDHVVLGAAIDPARNGGVPVDFAVPGLRLPQHEDLQLRVVSGAELIDAAVVPAPISGWAVRLDDARKTADANDTTEAYCRAAAVAPAGTPGDANGLCGTSSCREQGVARATRRAAPGELVVSEVFAKSSRSNPPGGGRDWLELHVAGERELDLNGLTITSTSRASGASVQVILASEECIPVAPGSYPVVAYSLDPAATGGVVAIYAAPALALANEAPLYIDLWHGEMLVDRAEVPAPEPGRAAALDPAAMTAAANDVESAFCFSRAAFVFDEQGTPGRPNLCGPLCMDEGGQRPLVSPEPGDLVITEIFPDPLGADAARDWLEVYVTASVDLNGLTLRNSLPGAERSWVLASPPGLPADACLRVTVDEPDLAGRFVVLGGTAAAASFGISVAAVFGGAGDTLLYSPSYVPKSATPAGKAVRLERGAVVLDEAFYPFGLPEGRSFALAPDVLDASGNDDPERWCASSAALTPPPQVATGTPGAPNPDRCE